MNLESNKVNLKNREYILDIALLLVLIQIGRVIVKYIFLSQLVFTYENVNISNIISFMLVGVSLVTILRGSSLFNSSGQRLINLNNRYNNKKERWIMAILSLMGIIGSFYYENGYFLSTLLLLVLSLIVQPFFEEVLFREYLWNYISKYEKNENKILIIISIFSALFNIGYWDIISQNLSVVGSSYYTIDIILSKVIIGFITSLILGLIKVKYKDTSLCVFSHSFINVFLR